MGPYVILFQEWMKWNKTHCHYLLCGKTLYDASFDILDSQITKSYKVVDDEIEA